MNATFQGGVWLPDSHVEHLHPIETPPIAPTLYVALRQHRGIIARCLVKIGDHVTRGEKIAEADGTISANVHAPWSGTVTAIENGDIAMRRHPQSPVVVISTDRSDHSEEKLPALSNYLDLPADQLCLRLRDAGLVGMGGAMFPTSAKLLAERKHDVNNLIINATESEPYYQCDTALILRDAKQMILAAQLAIHMTGVASAIFALTERQPEAMEALKAALSEANETRIKIQAVSAKYPIGGERQLVQALFNKEVPSGGFPLSIGVICLNVTTVAYAFRAVVHGETVTKRIVSFDGPGFARAANLELPLGTPVAHATDYLGGYTEQADYLIAGGPIGGLAMAHDDMPILKGSGCFVSLPSHKKAQVRPCIRCGECASVCPASLQPQQLFRYREDASTLEALHLLDCIECGCCDLVCPSHINLTGSFKDSKQMLLDRQHEQQTRNQLRERKVQFDLRKQAQARRSKPSLAIDKRAREQVIADALAEAKKKHE